MSDETRQRARRWGGALSNGLFWAAFALVVFLAYGNLPNRWYHVLYITSGSMAPTIRPGDLIIITPKPAVLKPGMILTLSVNGHLVTHRLVGVGEYGELITQGDANAVPDQWGEAAVVGVVGVYRARLPYLGYLALLPGQLAKAAGSGAWFTASEEIPGVLSAHHHWTPSGHVNLRGHLAAWPFVENDQHGVELQICLTNAGDSRLEGLSLPSRILAQTAEGGAAEVLSAYLDDGGQTALAPGQEQCYHGRLVLGPAQAAQYQAIVQVRLPDAAAAEGQALATADRVALELTANFAFDLNPAPQVPTEPLPAPASPTPAPDTPTPPPLPTDTAVPPTPAGTSLGALLMDVSAAHAEGGQAIVTARLCVQNTGLEPTEGLALAAQVRFNAAEGAYVDLVGAAQTWAAPAPLPPGGLECYPVEIRFTPLAGASYQLAARATLTNHAGWLPGQPACPGPAVCAFGPEAQTDFVLPAAPPEPAPSATPTPETALP